MANEETKINNKIIGSILMAPLVIRVLLRIWLDIDWTFAMDLAFVIMFFIGCVLMYLNKSESTTSNYSRFSILNVKDTLNDSEEISEYFKKLMEKDKGRK